MAKATKQSKSAAKPTNSFRKGQHISYPRGRGTASGKITGTDERGFYTVINAKTQGTQSVDPSKASAYVEPASNGN